MAGVPPVEVLQLALPACRQAHLAPDQTNLPQAIGKNFDALSMVPPSAENGRRPHP